MTRAEQMQKAAMGELQVKYDAIQKLITAAVAWRLTHTPTDIKRLAEAADEYIAKVGESGI